MLLKSAVIELQLQLQHRLQQTTWRQASEGKREKDGDRLRHRKKARKDRREIKEKSERVKITGRDSI